MVLSQVCCFLLPFNNLIYAVSLVRKGLGRGGLGATMYAAHVMNESLPRAVEFSDADSPTTRKAKELILKMTSYYSSDRPSSDDVLQDVSVTFEQVCH